ERMEEANAWRNPVDLVALLEAAFEELPEALAAPRSEWSGRHELVEAVLTAEPAEILEALLAALRAGAPVVELASAVSFAAATRIARFPVTNEFNDWDTALHTFTFANAVEQGLRRSASPDLVRGILDAAMSVHLDRFLNVPATRLPRPEEGADPEALLAELPVLLDAQQQVVEATPRQHELRRGTDDAWLPLIASARYQAAHSPTARSQRQTFEIAQRLHR